MYLLICYSITIQTDIQVIRSDVNFQLFLTNKPFIELPHFNEKARVLPRAATYFSYVQ